MGRPTGSFARQRATIEDSCDSVVTWRTEVVRPEKRATRVSAVLLLITRLGYNNLI